MNRTNQQLVQQLQNHGVLKRQRLREAFLAVDRADFVPEEHRFQAYLDQPVAINEEVFTSQPSTIAFILGKLRPRAGQRVLEIGTGSGYLTALLAQLVGPAGRVYSIELVPELKNSAQNNLAKYSFENITLFAGDGKAGLPEQAPFDRIVSSAEARQLPSIWLEQLKVKGILITPFNSKILQLIKRSATNFSQKEFLFFSFVELK